ncbi:Eaa1 [Klebsiella pneumoniae]|nr:Eaa1 [Klebsiella pneumoniae]SVQ08310.1 Eaa1 [Klebsiella pneumoniae]SVQ59697.1 Eaa1 [Klebsiella pneumoniae]SVQ68259.1 Eaa1 [Klebsiella pneumoniae]SVQ82412.1 Eaa1 [Klebsiella pneumoniae]
MALAAMDSEPVAWRWRSEPDKRWHLASRGDLAGEVEPLYRHALQPVAHIPVLYKGAELLSRSGLELIRDGASFATDLESACMAEALLSVAQPAPVVPDDVLDALQKVARISLDLNDFDGDRRGIADCLCDAEEALIEVVNRRAAMLQAGNSPVIPDGYVMVPKVVTPEIGNAINEVGHRCTCGNCSQRLWDLLLAAAPQPQSAQQNIPEIIPGWIPVSERMPDDDDFVYIWPRPDFGVELHVGQYCECSPKGDGWYAQVYEQNYGIEWHPITVTHWMPLPAAPQEVNHG